MQRYWNGHTGRRLVSDRIAISVVLLDMAVWVAAQHKSDPHSTFQLPRFVSLRIVVFNAYLWVAPINSIGLDCFRKRAEGRIDSTPDQLACLGYLMLVSLLAATTHHDQITILYLQR